MPGKLSRKKANRDHLIRNLCTSLILHEAIVTTVPKGKLVKAEVDSILSDCKSGTLAARRRAKQFLFDDMAVSKIFEVYNAQFKNVTGGMVKMTKLGSRLGDAAPIAKLELAKPVVAKTETVKEEVVEEKPKTKKSSKK
ncbi:MAG: 50S ribosomal protein L17 [Patescibacteria group bacterium]|jgi:large subunit ribosomal protein L17